MTKRVVSFDRVEIRRVLGITHEDGFQLKGLSPGVNLIHGPNGSGKSTAALVIQELLWPGRTGLERPTVSGAFLDGDTKWSVDIDAGHVETTCDGKPGSVPELGPAENRGRYRLALHELVVDDNADFAKLIADASHGGYDLEAAAGELRFTERPSAPSKHAATLKEAVRKVKDASQDLVQGEREESQLPDFRRQRIAAVAAAGRIEMLTKAKEHLEAAQTSEQVKLQLDSMPTGLAQVRAEDRETLDGLDAQRATIEKELVSERQSIEQARAKLKEASLPPSGVAPSVVADLRIQQRDLQDLESELQRYHRELDEAGEGEKRARARLGPDLTDDQLGAVDVVEIEELGAFARVADKARNRDKVLEERRGYLAAGEAEAIRGLDAPQIHEGITALAHWLAAATPEATPTPKGGWPTFLAAALLVVLGVVLGYLYHPAWLLLIGAALLVVILHRWIVKSSGSATNGTPRKAHRESYEATGLKVPQSWETSAVVQELRSLIALAQARSQEDDRLGQLKQLDVKVEEAAKVHADVERRRLEIVKHLGLKVEVADEWLPLVVANISAWQASSTKVTETQHGLTTLEGQRDAILQRINAELQPFGYAALDSASTAAGFIDALAERQSAHEGAVKDERDADDRIKRTHDPLLQRVAGERDGLFERLGLDESQESLIDQWIVELPKYVALKKKWDEAETLREDRRAALSADPELLALDDLDIQQQIEAQRNIADKRDQLVEKIAEIEAAIQRAKDGYELSDLLSDRDAAEIALSAGREQSGAAVTGAILTKWVRTVAIESARPQVFSRARELLTDLTRGKLLLELDDHASPPKFRARSGAGAAQPVENLSIGERVQLLIAVRIAFLEQDEPTRLPLLLDEALGTSDDGRAKEIIDTIIEVARAGRQVFYFTAQHDEVGKWVARLKESEVAHEVIDLAQVRKLGAAEAAPLHIASIDPPQPLAPDEMSHPEYGIALGVPDIDPVGGDVDGLHLWHVIDDVDRLHALLRHRITSWGQLRTLQRFGGKGLVADGESVFEDAELAARAIDAAFRAWRIGRGTRVDRRALQDSKCVTDRFMDEVAEVAQQMGGDAEALVTSLADGAVAGWREKRTVELRDFFEANGFLASDEPLSEEDIRVRVQAAVADELREGRLTSAFVDRVVAAFA